MHVVSPMYIVLKNQIAKVAMLPNYKINVRCNYCDIFITQALKLVCC